MSSGNSVFEITQSLGDEDAGRIKRLLENGIKIPAQPRVLDQLRKLTARKELDVRALAKVINQDPGLTALLFKVVGNRLTASTNRLIRWSRFCMRSACTKPSTWSRPSH
jgi:hypothetical protein